MASESKSESNKETKERSALPFEPKKNKPAEKKPKAKPSPIRKSWEKQAVKTTDPQALNIPDVVSRRMAKRMAAFCGIPTFAAVGVFIVSYFLISKNIVELPHTAVVLVSMGLFGLGVLGLSYGLLSASWDEESPGSLVGWSEFNTNLGRMTAAWREARQSKKSSS